MANEKAGIWDPFRKKWVARTPEEEVRQAFAAYLIQELGYPESLMRSEVSLEVHHQARRADLLVDKPAGSPILLVECKAPSHAINQQVFEQAARYNLALRLPFLVLTNGKKHYCCKVDLEAGRVDMLSRIPPYGEL